MRGPVPIFSRLAKQRWTRNLTMSAVEGSRHPPLCHKTLPDYFASEILQKHATKPALICRNEHARSLGGPRLANLGVESHLAWDFADFETCISAAARGLLAMGIQKGDRVGVLMGNNSAYATLQWACASIGAILVTINPAYRVNELAAALRHVGVKHLFVVPRIRSSAYIQLLADLYPSIRSANPGEIQEEALPDLRNIVVVDNEESCRAELDALGVKSLIDWREVFVWRQDRSSLDQQRQAAADSLHKDEVINLQFTSGTTGSPKAVSLTHHNLLNNALSVGRCMHLTDRDLVCNVPPLFHCFGLVLGNLAAWSYGAGIVFPSEIFDPHAIVDAIIEERCTALHGVPTHFLGVLAEIDDRRARGEAPDTRSLRTGIAAGSPIPIALMQELIAKLNLVDLTNAYGMTETSPVSFQTTPEDPVVKRVETVGKVQPHVRAKIVDTNGQVVPVGVPGQICVAGYLVQKGYWEDEAQTAQVMQRDAEGTLWMHTGDEGIMDEEGYLKIVGRIKDIIIRGGENLFPVQIENALTTHPGIHEAAAIAVPDTRYGEVVGAWVVRAPGHDDISKEEVRNAVSDAMNPQNAPAWVWFTDELPKTASGKVMKHILRDRSKKLLKDNDGRVAGQ
ncbi:acetyl-CoA synthetase-like protein [Armillaria gallica]|uniref:Acetyl-CoA synthetase-like protein n=1 Tax=Armillaria gallica TaxID=47427 RepID=A0A2H3DHM5_ARMGA|nr:acetyl-CoA synthetase-like protein [Armillaria gallica]